MLTFAYGRHGLFPVLLLLLLVFKSDGASFVKNRCTDRTEGEISEYISSGIQDTTPQQILDMVDTANMLGGRAFDRTWATQLTLNEVYTPFQLYPAEKADVNSKRFGYPWGEASGGYGNKPIIQSEPRRKWETRSREIADMAVSYMRQLSNEIPGYEDHFNIIPHLDCGVPRRFHATHAELKLLTRMMSHGELPFGEQVLISVSRHMCYSCRRIVAHLARNGKRRIVVATPRRGTRNDEDSLQQPKYIYFKEDGSFEVFQRPGANAFDKFKCVNFSFAAIPANLDTYMPPPARHFMNRVAARQMNQPSTACEENRHDGPRNACFYFIRKSLTKAITCRRGGTITGIHGTFGDVDSASPEFPEVLSSIGTFCDVVFRESAIGTPGTTPFELNCPDGHQMSGIHGRMGDFVDAIGIICTRIRDGAVWRSELKGNFFGGSPVEKSCKVRTAGYQLTLWPGEKVIDGLGMCCQ